MTARGRRPVGRAGGVFALAAAIQFGVVVVLASRLARGDVPVTTALALRFGVACLVLAGAALALGRPLVPAEGERAAVILLAVLGYAVESSAFFAALAHGTAAAVTLLFYTYPVVVALGSWGVLRRGRPPRRTGLALVLTSAGVAIVVGAGGSLVIERAGVALALLSALIISGYLLGADALLRRTEPLTSALWVSGVTSMTLFASSFATGGWQPPVGWFQWGSILGMGVATAGAFVCLLEGIRRIGAERSSIVSSAEPLAAALLAWVFLDQPVGLGVALGGVLILAGAVLASLGRAAEREAAIP